MERAAIEELYRRYGPAVYRRARTLLGDGARAEDAMQEVFIRALKADLDFSGASPMTWLYRVTTNYCLNIRRDRVRQSKLREARLPRGEAAVRSGHDERVAASELLDRVPLELAQIAVYYYIDEMSQDEIAEVVGVSRRTVGNRLEAFRALAKSSFGEQAEAVP